MKRTLAAALSTLALAAAGAQAQTLAQPQPSFVDFVPLEAHAGSASSGSSRTPLSRDDRPQPSFIDYVDIAPEVSGVRASGMSMATGGIPSPSFRDYPEAEVAGTGDAGRGYAQARSR